MRSVAAWSLAMVAVATVAHAQPGQIPPYHVPFDDDLFEEPAMEIDESDPPAPDQPQADKRAGKPLTKEQRAVMKTVLPYLAIETIERSPASVLNALALERAKQDSGPPAETPSPKVANQTAVKIAQLQRHLITGNWPAVQQHLSELPEATAPLVYGHILGLLARSSMVQPMEIPAIAAVAGGNLTPPQIQQLGRLLKKSLGHSDMPHEFLSALAGGVPGLGGRQQTGRRNAVRLLLAADMLEIAETYLQPLKDDTDRKDLELFDLHAQVQMAHFVKKKEQPARDKAWQYSLIVWSSESASESQRQVAASRAIKLLSKIPHEVASQWIGNLLQEQPQRSAELMAQISRTAEMAYQSRNISARIAALASARIMGETILALPDKQHEPWLPALRLLVMPWLNESLKTHDEQKRVFTVPEDQKIPALDGTALAKSAPSAAWLAALSVDTATMARRLKAQSLAQAADWEAFRATTQTIVTYDPETARRVVDIYLSASLQDGRSIGGTIDELMLQFRGHSYTHHQLSGIRQHFRQQMWNGNNGSDNGIALTRVQQVKALKKLHATLHDLKEAGLPEPTADALTSAFVTSHSSAEVYRVEDIELVFGRIEDLPPETAFRLVNTMRGNLASGWRNPQTQKKAGTQRDESDMTREVLRGYDLAIKMCESARRQSPENVSIYTTAGLTHFDKSEFLYGLGADLATYMAIRDRAFALLQQASEQYAASLSDRTDNDLSIDVYLRWFQMALGASDLAYLTRQHSADKPQIEKLAAAIAQLDPAMADKHLKLFGKGLSSELASIPAPLKPRCLQQALVVLGDHAAGDDIRKLMAYYKELLDEVNLHLEIDGRDVVGHGQPFGARLAVRYSNPLGREADHFRTLLTKQYQPSGIEIDNKEKLEKEIREKLSESFDIVEIRFHKPTVEPRGYGRPGWRETPLAYLLLSAKDPAIDTIPSLQVDVQFRDGHGNVLLPIASRKQLIDARDAHPGPRPVKNVTVRQTLDTRQIDKGKLRLEIVTEAIGLIPPLSDVVAIHEDSTLSGFHVDGIEDHDVTILELDTSGDTVVPKCERTWILELSRSPDAVSVVEEFTFPDVVDATFVASYDRYDDADIVTCEQRVPIDLAVAYSGRRMTAYLAGSAAGIVLIGLLVVLFVRRRRPVTRPLEYPSPSHLTPFGVVAFLQRMQRDDRLQFTDRDDDILSGTISELEKRYFSRGDATVDDAELQEVADDWTQKARRILTDSNSRAMSS